MFSNSMSRQGLSTVILAFIGLLAGSACNETLPTLDKASWPNTVTSAKPLYITNDDSAREDGMPQSTVPTTTPGPTACPGNKSEPSRPWPSDTSFVSDRTATCSHPICTRSMIVPTEQETQVKATSTASGFGYPAPFAAWQEVLQTNVKLVFPKAKDIGLVGVALRGNISVSPAENAKPTSLPPWKAFHAPGAGVTVSADASGGSVYLVAFALHGQFETVVAPLVHGKGKLALWNKRPGTFVVENPPTVEQLPCGKNSINNNTYYELDKTVRVRFGVLASEPPGPDGMPPWDSRRKDRGNPYDHESEGLWELFVPVRGEGLLRMAERHKMVNAIRPVDATVKPGYAVMVPPDAACVFEPANPCRDGKQQPTGIHFAMPKLE